MADDFPVIDGVQVLVPPPEGYVVDFANPQTNAVLQHYLIFGIGGTLALVALLQRYYTKIFLSKGLWVDDDSITQGGQCHHVFEMSLDQYQDYALIAYIAAPIYMLCNGFTKLSLLTFYLNLSPEGWFRVSVWVVIALVSANTIVITFLFFFQCDPPRMIWTVRHQGGSCMNAAVLYIATAASNVVTDFILFVMPLPMVLSLRLRVMQKVGAVIVFAIASMTFATSIVRLVLLPPLLNSHDVPYDSGIPNVWTFVEANLFVICGSMPTLRKFFRHVAPRIMGSSGGYASSHGPYIEGNYRRPSHNEQDRSRKPRRPYARFPEERELQDFSLDCTSPSVEDDLEAGSTTVDTVARSNGSIKGAELGEMG
ncbi:hypothetical protein S40293_07378 [Stachybotrys chartarum IBT 40293]|nr:hypothetical protein S40293_07378 [Stachybotrys chartarum IBT 40293]KFA80714.1 hypothetical protein S40288_01799 [Stachybotrys chartarum IBT 40288]